MKKQTREKEPKSTYEKIVTAKGYGVIISLLLTSLAMYLQDEMVNNQLTDFINAFRLLSVAGNGLFSLGLMGATIAFIKSSEGLDLYLSSREKMHMKLSVVLGLIDATLLLNSFLAGEIVIKSFQ